MRFSSFDEILRFYSDSKPDAPVFYREEYGENVSVSYAQFYSAVNWRSAELMSTDGACEGILCDGSYENIIEIFAAVKAGLQVVLFSENVEQPLVDFTDADILWGDPELLEELKPVSQPAAEKHAGNILFFTSGLTSLS